MALINFDADQLSLRVVAGALEKYEPTERVKALSAKVDELRKVVKAEQEKHANEYREFLKAKVTPVVEEFRAEVEALNKEAYPELEKLRAGQVETATPKA